MEFPCDFIAARESYSPPKNPVSIFLHQNWRRPELAVRCRHFESKSCCATITFWFSSEVLKILYSLFGKRLSNVDRIAFSAFRTRILTSEYTYTTPPKIGVKSRCAATTFWGLNARVRASENRWQTTCLRCYAFTSRIVSRTLAIRRNTVKKIVQLTKNPQMPPFITSSVRLEFIPRIMRE